jgi:Putative transposase
MLPGRVKKRIVAAIINSPGTRWHHPHLHCVVPGGGLSSDGRRWVRGRAHFFFPVRVLSRLFRGIFLNGLQEAHAAGKLRFHGALHKLGHANAFAHLIKTCRSIEWVVYAKPPFGGPEQVLDYLGRYTHRVAISNNRLIRLDNGKVTFRWKDYQAGNRQKHMTLDAEEFLRRFLMHVLPAGFVRIRHYGWLANAQRRYKLALCRELLGVEQPAKEQQASAETLGEAGTGLKLASLMICRACGQGRMVVIEIVDATGSLSQPMPPIDSS